jgi:hypothetical protein
MSRLAIALVVALAATGADAQDTKSGQSDTPVASANGTRPFLFDGRMGMPGNCDRVAFFQNFLHDAVKRRRGVDHDIALRDIFFRCMQSFNKLLFDRSPTKLIFGSAGKPPF